MSKLRILIQGIGGIGGVVAGRLQRAGFKPVLVTSNPTITEAIKNNGLQIKTLKEDFSQEAEVYTSLDELPPGSLFDVTLLIMKANPVVKVAKASLPYLDPENGYLVTCQNGIVEDAVAEQVGADKVVSGIIGWGGTMHAPGVYEKTGPGGIHLGELDGSLSDRIKRLSSALKIVSPVTVTQNIRGALWSKLGINCTITTLGALTGDSLGDMCKNKKVRRAFLVVYREVVDTAHALGIKLERVAADPYLLYLPKETGKIKRFYKDKLVQIVGKKYGKLKSSSLQSLERGRKTEIDFLNGYVVKHAAKVGLEVPLNAALTKMIKEIEAAKRKIENKNMEELLGLLE
jgi:2-dehydropantoate 2-reductase